MIGGGMKQQASERNGDFRFEQSWPCCLIFALHCIRAALLGWIKPTSMLETNGCRANEMERE